MGQYFKIVNVKKRQYLNPHMFNDGLKLMEFGMSGGGTMTALAVLLADGNGRGGGDLNSENPIVGSWAGDQIVIAGDYADHGKFLPEDKSEQNLYEVAVEEGKDISAEVLDALMEDHWFREDFINHWPDFKSNSNDDYYAEVNKIVNKWKKNTGISTTKEYDVTGSKGNLYKITAPDSPSENWTCTCPAYTYHKVPGTACKHIKEIQQKVGVVV